MLIYYDNWSAIYINHNDVFHKQTKHIKIDCHFSNITCFKDLSNCFMSLLKISLKTSLQSHIEQLIFMLLFSNSRLSLFLLVFEGAISVQLHWVLGPIVVYLSIIDTPCTTLILVLYSYVYLYKISPFVHFYSLNLVELTILSHTFSPKS